MKTKGFLLTTGTCIMITRRNFLKQASMGTLGLAYTMMPRTAQAQESTSEQNIVMILIDDMGWSDLACYGNEFNETPNIDQLAQEGMLFTDAYAACPVCSPTRASIITGQYPTRIGITDFIPGLHPKEKLLTPVNRTNYLPLDIITIAEVLHSKGYVSACIGKWHLGKNREFMPDKQGFDSILIPYKQNKNKAIHFKFNTLPQVEHKDGDYLAEVLTEHAVDFIKENRKKPFFLFLSHYAVHIPLEAKKEITEKYKEKIKPLSGVNNPVYAAMVEHVDRSVGRIIETLREQNIEKQTVVVFMSDNGGLKQKYDATGPVVTTNAPLRGEKGSLYEGGIRVPLIIRWPGRCRPNTKCSMPVSSIDMFPTFIEISNAKKPVGHVIDGCSLVPLLKEMDGFYRYAIYWHYPHYHHSTPAGAIRQENWKLIEFFEDDHIELYDLSEDIAETHNLANENSQKAKDLREKLNQWRNSIGAAMPEPNPEFEPQKEH
jgi:arylsulfatase A